jgi:hypothetical protein
MGAACPFERMKRSLEESLGLDSLYLITWKKRTDNASAIEEHDVGCLETKQEIMKNLFLYRFSNTILKHHSTAILILLNAQYISLKM